MTFPKPRRPFTNMPVPGAVLVMFAALAACGTTQTAPDKAPSSASSEPTSPTGSGACDELLKRACDGLPTCVAFSEAFTTGARTAGDRAHDQCVAVLSNPHAILGLRESARNLVDAPGKKETPAASNTPETKAGGATEQQCQRVHQNVVTIAMHVSGSRALSPEVMEKARAAADKSAARILSVCRQMTSSQAECFATAMDLAGIKACR